MKHLKLFEGYYSDRIEQVFDELKVHMREDLIDWKNVFADEINHLVKLGNPYISTDQYEGEETINCTLSIDFNKSNPDKNLKFIFDTYSHMKKTLKDDYKIEAVWTDKFEREYDLISIKEIMNNVTSLEELKRIDILFQGK
jgi:hypothetical protein